MRTLDCQYKFYLVNNHGILEAHTSEDNYVYCPGLIEQVLELISNWFFRG